MANALAGLRDIHMPEPISWWPLAPGYWVVALFLAFILGTLFFHYRYRKSRRIKRCALRQLALYRRCHEQTPHLGQTAARLSSLLKQVALHYYPRSYVASLQGDAWLRFLTETSKQLDFEPARDALLKCPFRPETNQPVAMLFPLVKTWIKQRSGRCLN